MPEIHPVNGLKRGKIDIKIIIVKLNNYHIENY